MEQNQESFRQTCEQTAPVYTYKKNNTVSALSEVVAVAFS
jgi:hypothetical protein